MDLLSLSTSSSFSSYSTSNRSSSSGSSRSVSGDGGGGEDEDNGEVRSSIIYDVKQDASNTKQDRSINNKYRASVIEEQMDVAHDRISNLPDDIIHHILSFLDMKYAIQTTTLSKKWKLVPNFLFLIRGVSLRFSLHAWIINLHMNLVHSIT